MASSNIIFVQQVPVILHPFNNNLDVAQNNSSLFSNEKENNLVVLNKDIGVPQQKASNRQTSASLSIPSGLGTCSHVTQNATLPSQVGTHSHVAPKGNIDSVCQKEIEPEKFFRISERFVLSDHSIEMEPMQPLQIKDTKIDLTKVSLSNCTLQTVHQENDMFNEQLLTIKTVNDINNANASIKDGQELGDSQCRNKINCEYNVNSVLRPHSNISSHPSNQVSTLLHVQPAIKHEFSVYSGTHNSTVPMLQSAMQPDLSLEESNKIFCKAEPKLKISENLLKLHTFRKEKITVEPTSGKELQPNSTVDLMEMPPDNYTVKTCQDGDIVNKQLLPLRTENDTVQNTIKLSITDIQTLADLYAKSEKGSSTQCAADYDSSMPCANESEKSNVSLSKYQQKDTASFWPREEEVPKSLFEEIRLLKKLYVDNKCLICGFSSKSKRASVGWRYAKHMLVHLTAKCYKCDKCDKTFLNGQRLLSHSIVHKNVYPFPCDMCGKRYRHRVNWIRHKKRYHTEVQTDSFACSVCSKTFLFQTQLRRHYRTHTGEKLYYCSECNQSFSKKVSLETHMNNHKGIKPYRCNECDKSFTNKRYLQDHMNLHSKENTFECHLCQMKFNFKSNLAQHLKTHSDDRCHTCDECGKSFKLPHHLRQHLTTHGVTGSRYTRSRKRRKVIEVESSSSSDESIQNVD